MRWYEGGKQGGCNEGDFPLATQVLTEMIQTVAVVDRICFLADKAGVFPIVCATHHPTMVAELVVTARK